MGVILKYATILGFLTAPIIAFLNIRAITSSEVAAEFRPSNRMIFLAYIGLIASILFAVYYLYSLI